MAEALRAAVLEGVPHGFMTRRGGVSQAPVESLNCGLGAGDDSAAVAENRRRAADAVLPGAVLLGLHQVHSAEVVTVTEPWGNDARPHADAMVTDRPGLLLGVLTADCAPVLFADREAGVVGAAHAGWKGALGGVLEQTLLAMEALGARRERVVAAVGPTIGRESYEVDEQFKDEFAKADVANAHFFAAGAPGHFQFDLPAYVCFNLKTAGVATIEDIARDTYAEPDAFYSFRRATHRGEATYGRQLSLIGIARNAVGNPP